MKWVVYTFNGPDGEPFYVGSGKSTRPEEHMKGRKTSKRLAARFDEIAGMGAVASVHIVSEHQECAEARAGEAALMQELLPSGKLLNRMVSLSHILNSAMVKDAGNKLIAREMPVPASLWRAVERYQKRYGAFLSKADALRWLILAGLRAERRAEK
jgi:hypothetical protein